MNGAELCLRIEGLLPARMVLIEVIAVDAAGNESARLTLSVTTPDGGPDLAQYDIDLADWLNDAFLSWPEAEDDVGVTGHRVVVDGEVKFETAETSARIEGLEAAQHYTVRIDARDAANH